MKKSMVFFCSAFIAMLGLAGFANTLTVTSLVDEFPTANNVLDTSALTQGTFRWALANSSEGDTIVFDDSIAGGTINMVGVADVTPQQDTSFVIAHALTIKGNGVTINGGWNHVIGNGNTTGTRIFLTAAGQSKTTIRNLNLVNGRGAVWYGPKTAYLGGAVNAGSPLRLENCQLVNNCTMDWIEYSYSYPDHRGGGAISAESDLELVSCFFGTNSIPGGTGSYGGAIRQVGGSLFVEDSVFDHDYTLSFGGGALYLGSAVTGATFTNCKFLENASSGASDNGGAIYSEMSGGGALKFFGCVLRGGSNGSNSSGGGIRIKNAAEFTAVNCEFSDCNAKLGGGIHGSASNPLFVNCTFYGNAASTWGSALEVFSPTYLVNCTIAGSYLYGKDDGITYVSSTLRLLNTVFAYNYYGASSANSGDGYNQGFERICSLYKGTSSVPSIPTYTFATSLADVPTATKLFADYEMVSTRHGDTQDTRATLPATVLMPKLGDDDDAPRVVEIGEDSVLASGGYPVRVNVDYSYVEYSADGGSTWTQLIKRAGASTDNLTQITADQRGVPYADGAVPIGAATFGNGCQHEHTTTNGYVAATCEGVGDTGLVTCDECGATLFDHEEIPALDHAWDEGSITTPPTCTEKGVKTYTCTRTGCDGTKTEEVDELGHEWGEWVVTKEPSKTETGLRERDCQRDGCSAHQEEAIPMIVDVAALRNIAVVTTIGTAPTLPAKVAGLKADGMVGGEYDVVWNSASAPSAAGITMVNGTATVNGEPMSVTASVRAAVPATGEAANVALGVRPTAYAESGIKYPKLSDQYALGLLTTGMYENDAFPVYALNTQGTEGEFDGKWAKDIFVFEFALAEPATVSGFCVWHMSDSGYLLDPYPALAEISTDNGNTWTEVAVTGGAKPGKLESVLNNNGTQTGVFKYVYSLASSAQAVTNVRFKMSPYGIKTPVPTDVQSDSKGFKIAEIEIFGSEGGSGDSVDPLTTDTLSALAVDGNAVAGFAPTTYDYTVEKGTEITSATSTDNVGITILQKSVTASDNAYVVTLAEDGESTQKYTVAMPDVWESGTIIYLR